MRTLAVCAILAVVGYAMKEALEPPTVTPTPLAPAVYAVSEPIAVTVADSIPPIGEVASAPTVPTPQPLNGPATVAVSP